MISDSSSDKDSKSSGDIDFPKNLSNSNVSKDFFKNIVTNTNLKYSTVPKNFQRETNQTSFSGNNINMNQPQEEEGVFSSIFNFFKKAWTIEEEEFIDAHGFKAKRPKQKMPLRKKEDKFDSALQMMGGQSMTYATQHSGFGNLFL